MDKLKTLQMVYETLLQEGRITNKKSFAELLGYDYSGVITAMKGNPKYLTDSLVAKASSLIGDSVPFQDEDGTSGTAGTSDPDSVTIPSSVVKIYHDLSTTVKTQQDTIKMLVEIIREDAGKTAGKKAAL